MFSFYSSNLEIKYIFPGFICYLCYLHVLGCVVNGVVGDGTKQGTCESDTDVCTASGECLGTYEYHTQSIITVTIIFMCHTFLFLC